MHYIKQVWSICRKTVCGDLKLSSIKLWKLETFCEHWQTILEETHEHGKVLCKRQLHTRGLRTYTVGLNEGPWNEVFHRVRLSYHQILSLSWSNRNATQGQDGGWYDSYIHWPVGMHGEGQGIWHRARVTNDNDHLSQWVTLTRAGV